MKSNTCKIAFLPDIHIGKPKLAPDRVRDHLEALVYNRIPDIDLLVFGGDFFDSALNMNSTAGVYAALIIDEITALAKKHKTFIRVINGTFFHDRHQNKFFDIKSPMCGNIDGVPLLKVYDKIDLEFLTPLNLSVMYCPDNQPGNVTEQLLELLKVHRLKQVDFLFSHGYYEYLLPRGLAHVPQNTINYDLISPMIRGRILNGHVHIPKQHKKLISGGSFERLAHGEEHDKGYFIVTYDTKSGSSSVEFIVNPYTTPFITIDVHSFESVEACIEHIDNTICKIRSEQKDQSIHIRLEGLSSIDNYILEHFEQKYSNVFMTIKSKSNQTLEYELDEVISQLPIITEQNLAELIYDNLQDKNITLEQIKGYL